MTCTKARGKAWVPGAGLQAYRSYNALPPADLAGFFFLRYPLLFGAYAAPS